MSAGSERFQLRAQTLPEISFNFVPDSKQLMIMRNEWYSTKYFMTPLTLSDGASLNKLCKMLLAWALMGDGLRLMRHVHKKAIHFVSIWQWYVCYYMSERDDIKEKFNLCKRCIERRQHNKLCNEEKLSFHYQSPPKSFFFIVTFLFKSSFEILKSRKVVYGISFFCCSHSSA